MARSPSKESTAPGGNARSARFLFRFSLWVGPFYVGFFGGHEQLFFAALGTATDSSNRRRPFRGCRNPWLNLRSTPPPLEYGLGAATAPRGRALADHKRSAGDGAFIFT